VIANRVPRRARRHEPAVYEQDVGPIREDVEASVVVRLGRHRAYERAAVKEKPVGVERVARRAQKGAEAEAEVVGRPRFDEGTKVRNLSVFEKTELHGTVVKR
jgi:hypothetical protein